jgi:putative radical SAM enzyme (TIGR03279 family)
MEVIAVQTGSPAAQSGIRVGDALERINGHPARDVLDVRFWMADEGVILELRRDGEVFEVRIEGGEDRDLGLEFEEMTIRRCGNRCVFCFVDQLPSGMRSALYVKDEDVRLSFLHGSYVTLTDVSGEDIGRIVEQRLSPLYISVHATDPKVRRRLLGRRSEADILATMRRLADAGIWMHTQIVLCPGINDGSELERTVRDLSAFFPQVRSIAVVPVGLTRHRGGLAPLKPVGRSEARRCIEQVTEWQGKFLDRCGERLVFAADECYLTAGYEIPAAESYEDFPQIENGVGMVRQFLDAFEAAEKRLPERLRERLSLTLVTGRSAEGFLRRMLERLEQVDRLSVRLVTVENRFFGASITVSGLLTGQDILAALEREKVGNAVLLPPNCMNEDGLLLDDQTPEEMTEALGVPVRVGSYDLVESVLKSMSNE